MFAAVVVVLTVLAVSCESVLVTLSCRTGSGLVRRERVKSGFLEKTRGAERATRR